MVVQNCWESRAGDRKQKTIAGSGVWSLFSTPSSPSLEHPEQQ
jgi:hypothetical protein